MPNYDHAHDLLFKHADAIYCVLRHAEITHDAFLEELLQRLHALFSESTLFLSDQRWMSSTSNIPCPKTVILEACPDIVSLAAFANVQVLTIRTCPCVDVDSVVACRALTHLTFDNMMQLTKIPNLGCLERLVFLKVSNCAQLVDCSIVSDTIHTFHIANCPYNVDIATLKTLTTLKIEDCDLANHLFLDRIESLELYRCHPANGIVASIKNCSTIKHLVWDDLEVLNTQLIASQLTRLDLRRFGFGCCGIFSRLVDLSLVFPSLFWLDNDGGQQQSQTAADKQCFPVLQTLTVYYSKEKWGNLFKRRPDLFAIPVVEQLIHLVTTFQSTFRLTTTSSTAATEWLPIK